MVVEIVSDSSVVKDTVRLREAYFLAGVREYWLIDARGEELRFQILHRGEKEFQESPADSDGFQRSQVLDCSYCLQRTRHQRGHWVYDLQHK